VELDGKELAARNTLREKEEIHRKKIKEESLKVAAYIAMALKNLQHHSTIWLPYTSSKFNSILKVLFDIFCSMQKSLYSSMIKFI
jgi:hypothetical protein